MDARGNAGSSVAAVLMAVLAHTRVFSRRITLQTKEGLVMDATRVVGLIVAAVLMFALLPVGAFAEATGRIEGRVVDTGTKEPLVGAKVALEGTRFGAASNESGRYSVENVPEGKYRVVVTMTGYRKERKEVSAVSGETATLNFELTEALFELGEMVVTATRTPTLLADVPTPVDVVTKEEISRSHIGTMDEAVRGVTGVYVTHAHRLEVEPFVFMRGIKGDSRNLILIDGLPNSREWRRFPAENVERIEVVKGPGSSLYGESAMGGVINIITRKPKEGLEVRSSFGLETYGTYTDYFCISGKKGELSYLLSARNRKTEGYVSSFATKSAKEGEAETKVTGWEKTTDKYGNEKYLIGDKGKVYYDDEAYEFKVGFSSFRIGYTHTDQGYGYKGGESYLKDAEGNPVREGKVELKGAGKVMTLYGSEFDPSSYGHTPADLLAVSYSTELGPVNLIASGQWDHYFLWYVCPSWNSYSSGDRNRIVGNLQLNFPVGWRQEFTLGGYAKIGKEDVDYWSLFNGFDPETKKEKTKRLRGRTNLASLYLQDRIKLLEPLSLYLNGRVDYWETRDGYYWDKATAITYEYPEKSKVNFSPKASLIFKPLAATTLRASWGQAFRGPNVWELYYDWGYGTSLRSCNPDLEPEYLTSYEASIEQLIREKVSVKVAYFNNQMSDFIENKYLSPEKVADYNAKRGTSWETIMGKANVAKAESKGVEAEVRIEGIEALPGLSVSANYTYNPTEMLENPADPKTEGKQLSCAPENMYNFGVNYSLEGLDASLTFRHADQMYYASDNSDKVTGVMGAHGPVDLLNGSLSYTFKQWTLSPKVSLFCNNILDKEYYSYYKAAGRVLGVRLDLSESFK